MVDKCSGSDKCADDPDPAAVARRARLGLLAKAVDRLGQCTVKPCVINRVTPEITGRLSTEPVVAKLLSDPVGARPIYYIKPRLLSAEPAVERLLPVKLDRQLSPRPIKLRLLFVKLVDVGRQHLAKLAIERQPSTKLAVDKQPSTGPFVNRAAPASSIELGATTSHRARDQGVANRVVPETTG